MTCRSLTLVSIHLLWQTPEEALAILKKNSGTKAERIAKLEESGYPAYTTSAGWLGYPDDMIRQVSSPENACRHIVL